MHWRSFGSQSLGKADETGGVEMFVLRANRK
jgi:hypothetical protein